MRRQDLITGGVFVVLFAIVAILLYLNFFAGSPPPERAVVETPAGSAAPALVPLGAEPGGVAPIPGQHTMLLYFQGVDVGLLFPEERVAAPVVDGNAQARQVLEELARGPTRELLPTVPEGTRVREVYFDSSGIAYVDFSGEIRDNHCGGSAEELMTVESIVNTLARNVPQVQAVRFLIDGRPADTLAGHVDLALPLRPNSDRMALTP